MGRMAYACCEDILLFYRSLVFIWRNWSRYGY
jgi:hypothetical protein